MCTEQLYVDKIQHTDVSWNLFQKEAMALYFGQKKEVNYSTAQDQRIITNEQAFKVAIYLITRNESSLLFCIGAADKIEALAHNLKC